MRHPRGVLGSLGALAILLTLAAPVLAGGAQYKPDGWIRYYDFYSEIFPGDHSSPHVGPGPWKGKNIYNASAKKQTAKTKVYPGFPDTWAYERFDVTVQNDGAPSSFKIHGAATVSGVDLGSFRAYYYRGTTNITQAVETGTYTTPTLARGGALTLTVRIDVGDGTFPGESGWTANNVSTILISSTSDPSRRDAVKIKLVLGSCNC